MRTNDQNFSPGGWQNIAISIGVIIVLYTLNEYNSYREISWKEFFNEFLEPGLVSFLHSSNS